MYSPYTPPSERDFDQLFTPPVRGGGMSDINIYRAPRMYQRGGSLFSFLGRIIRGTIPILKNFLLPEIPNLISNVRGDVNSGVNITQSMKKHGRGLVKNVSRNVYNKLRGGGNIKKRGRKVRRKSKVSEKKNTKVGKNILKPDVII